MKKITFVLLTTIVLSSCSEVSLGSGKKAQIKNMEDSLSYCLGLSLGSYLQNIESDINIAVFEKAVNDILNDEELDIPMEQLNYVMQIIQQKRMMDISMKNVKEGKDFLEANKVKEGIITTESGLQYEILKEGNGPVPDENSKVSVHYVGTLLDGTQFDSSYDRGEPATFGVNQVIRGWTEALLLMPVGSKWKLYIPSELGYGERPPQRSKIKPNSVLIFEVELLDIIQEDNK